MQINKTKGHIQDLLVWLRGVFYVVLTLLYFWNLLKHMYTPVSDYITHT